MKCFVKSLQIWKNNNALISIATFRYLVGILLFSSFFFFFLSFFLYIFLCFSLLLFLLLLFFMQLLVSLFLSISVSTFKYECFIIRPTPIAPATVEIDA